MKEQLETLGTIRIIGFLQIVVYTSKWKQSMQSELSERYLTLKNETELNELVYTGTTDK